MTVKRADGPTFEHMGTFLGLDEPIGGPEARAKAGPLAWSVRLLLLSLACVLVVGLLVKDPGYLDPQDVVEPGEGDLVVIKVDTFPLIWSVPSNETDERYQNNLRLYVGNPGSRPVSTEGVEVNTTISVEAPDVTGVHWFTSEFRNDVLQPRQAEVLWVMGPDTHGHQNGTVNIHATILYEGEVIDDYRAAFTLDSGVIEV